MFPSKNVEDDSSYLSNYEVASLPELRERNLETNNQNVSVVAKRYQQHAQNNLVAGPPLIPPVVYHWSTVQMCTRLQGMSITDSLQQRVGIQHTNHHQQNVNGQKTNRILVEEGYWKKNGELNEQLMFKTLMQNPNARERLHEMYCELTAQQQLTSKQIPSLLQNVPIAQFQMHQPHIQNVVPFENCSDSMYGANFHECYRISEQIGQGGQGSVYSGKQKLCLK